MFSKTARQLLKNKGIEIGFGTYGPCFDVANVTPKVSIGKYCSIAPGVSIYTRDHPYQFVSTHPFFYNSSLKMVEKDVVAYGKTIIGNDVWIGRNTCILPSCNYIGDGAVIGAGSVITHDIPAYSIAVGVPAKIIKYRFDEKTIDAIEKSRWWDFDFEDIKDMREMMTDVNAFLNFIENKKKADYEKNK